MKRHYFVRDHREGSIRCKLCSESYTDIARAGSWNACTSETIAPTDDNWRKHWDIIQNGGVVNDPDSFIARLEPVAGFKVCYKCDCTRPGPRSTCHVSGLCNVQVANGGWKETQWDRISKRMDEMKKS